MKKTIAEKEILAPGDDKRAIERKRQFDTKIEKKNKRITESLNPPEIEGLLADNIVPIALLSDMISVLVPAWPRVRDGDNIRVYMDDQSGIFIGSTIITDSDEQVFPAIVEIPARVLTHGSHTINYLVDAESGSQALSFPLRFVVDREAPTPVGGATLPDSYNNTITRENLNSNNGLTPLNIPPYLRMEAGDYITLFWTGANGMGARLDDYQITQNDVDTQTVSINLPESAVISGGEGSARVYYYIRDRAGNTSIRSPDENISVILNPAPKNLVAPYIPLANTPITDADTREPVKALIPQYNNILPGDLITLRWRGINVASVTLAAPIASEAYVTEIPIPRSVIWASGSGASEVDYLVTRGTLTLISPVVSVETNLDIPGPEDPNKDTIENEELLPLVVQGNASQQNNKLLPQDVRQGAVALVPWYESAKADETIRVYWGGRSSANFVEYKITQQDVTDKPKNIAIALPARIIDTTPENSAWPVTYDLLNATNSNLGQTSYVDVHLVGAGGPDGLRQISFLGKNNRGWLIEGELVNPSTSLYVPVYDNMFIGDVVTVHWIGNTKTNGKGTDITETQYTSTVTVEQRHLRDGVQFAVPYRPYIIGIGYGCAKAYYTVTQNGLLFDSERDQVKVDMEGPAG